MALTKVLLIKKKRRINLIKPLEDTIRRFPSRKSTVVALYTITVRMTQNNIFCYIGNIVTNKTLLKLSSGNVKINITKKTLKFHSTRIIPYFFSLLRSKMIRSVISVNFIVPKAIKKKIFFLVLSKFKKLRRKKYFFKLFIFRGKKCFNGCRAPKLKRKKRHKFRILKF
jgi:hypothetical protein